MRWPIKFDVMQLPPPLEQKQLEFARDVVMDRIMERIIASMILPASLVNCRCTLVPMRETMTEQQWLTSTDPAPLPNVCAFTSVCEEDLSWLTRYELEAERLSMAFALHLDRVDPNNPTVKPLLKHPLCAGWTQQPLKSVEFNEQHKQDVFDLVVSKGYSWAMAWDVDEVFEQHFWTQLDVLTDPRVDLVSCRWLNLWGNRNHIRVDLNFAEGHRAKFYNLKEFRRWKFDHPITNGAKLQTRNNRDCVTKFIPLVCLHAGMMTHELRVLHKERWDRIYSTALRGDPNPYGFWKQALETEHTAVTVKHGYFNV